MNNYLLIGRQTGERSVCEMRRALPVHDKNYLYCWQFLHNILVTSYLFTTGVSPLMDFTNIWTQRDQKHFSIQSDFDGANEMVQ